MVHYSLRNRFHVAVRLLTSKCGKNKKVAHEAQPSVSLMFLPHFDILCDLLLNRRTATWILFVLYNNKLKYTEKMSFYLKFRLFDRHENSTDVVLCLYKKKRTEWLLYLAKNCDLFKFKIQKIIIKKSCIERCRHLCVCPLIDHRREPIRMRDKYY